MQGVWLQAQILCVIFQVQPQPITRLCLAGFLEGSCSPHHQTVQSQCIIVFLEGVKSKLQPLLTRWPELTSTSASQPRCLHEASSSGTVAKSLFCIFIQYFSIHSPSSSPYPRGTLVHKISGAPSFMAPQPLDNTNIYTPIYIYIYIYLIAVNVFLCTHICR